MAKKIISIVSVLGLLITAGPVLAVPTFQAFTLSTLGTQGTLTLPSAADNSPVISLGSAIDPGTGKLVEGYAIIHYKDKVAKPTGKPGGGATQCYGFLAKGAKWKTVEPWVTNSSNTRGLDTASVLSVLSTGVLRWEDAADGTVGNNVGMNILGDGSSTSNTLVADTVSPDNQNEVYFANVSTQNAIAVTIVWGIFGGPTFQRELVEWDQVYDDVDYDWSLAGAAGKMDLDNIATHELGHSVGMADIYDSVCSEVTMYGYAGFSETKKTTLEAPDILGVSTLY